MISCAAVLVVVPRFQIVWQTETHADPSRGKPSSAVDAAVLAGGSRSRAMRLGRTFPLASPFAACFLAWSFAATNLTPALLFEPWIDGQTIGPAVLRLAAGPADARAQAALLALCRRSPAIWRLWPWRGGHQHGLVFLIWSEVRRS